MDAKEADRIKDIFKCVICMKQLHDAQLCPHCSKFYCYACIRYWLTEQRYECSNCRVTLHLSDLVKCRWAEDVGRFLDKLAINSDIHEATLTFVIPDFKHMNAMMYSPPTTVRGLPWRIMVIRRENDIGLFLQCNVDSKSKTWSCRADVVWRIKSQTQQLPDFEKKPLSHVFCSEENDWGYLRFYDRSLLLNPQKGFVKDGSVIFEIDVSADKPNGVG